MTTKEPHRFFRARRRGERGDGSPPHPLLRHRRSAVATLIAQVVNNGYLWYAMKKVNHFTVLGRLKKIMTAGAIMGACAVLFLFLGMNVIVNVVLCTLIYFIVLRILREPLMIEIKRLVFPPAARAL